MKIFPLTFKYITELKEVGVPLGGFTPPGGGFVVQKTPL